MARCPCLPGDARRRGPSRHRALPALPAAAPNRRGALGLAAVFGAATPALVPSARPQHRARIRAPPPCSCHAPSRPSWRNCCGAFWTSRRPLLRGYMPWCAPAVVCAPLSSDGLDCAFSALTQPDGRLLLVEAVAKLAAPGAGLRSSVRQTDVPSYSTSSSCLQGRIQGARKTSSGSLRSWLCLSDVPGVRPSRVSRCSRSTVSNCERLTRHCAAASSLSRLCRSPNAMPPSV